MQLSCLYPLDSTGETEAKPNLLTLVDSQARTIPPHAPFWGFGSHLPLVAYLPVPDANTRGVPIPLSPVPNSSTHELGCEAILGPQRVSLVTLCPAKPRISHGSHMGEVWVWGIGYVCPRGGQGWSWVLSVASAFAFAQALGRRRLRGLLPPPVPPHLRVPMVAQRPRLSV